MNLEESESRVNSTASRGSEVSTSERRNLPVNTNRNQENVHIQIEEKEEDREVFEAPEFLYKYSSTFFKRATAKEKKLNKIFNLRRDNKEVANIRSERNVSIKEEISFKPEDSFASNKSIRSFKKTDLKTEDIKFNKENIKKHPGMHKR